MNIMFQSAVDNTVSPPGKHTMSIFAQHAPYKLRDGDWAEEREKLGDNAIETLAEYAPNMRKAVLHREVLTPVDLEQRFNITGGHIFHGELTPDQILSFRPVPGWCNYRTPIAGLYMCGSGTHPGGAVTGAPGHNAAQAILDDLKSGVR
jgi:phytoene dehydrogenase-like protein